MVMLILPMSTEQPPDDIFHLRIYEITQLTLAQSVTLRPSRQGNSEPAIVAILNFLIWVSGTPIYLCCRGRETMTVVSSDDRIDVRAWMGKSNDGAVWNPALRLVEVTSISN